MTPSDTTLFWALLGGFVPALFWLWFWLQEDKLHPEPRGRIIAAFLGGMAIVIPAYFLEQWTLSYFGWNATTIVIWAATEEILKFGACYFLALRTRDYEAPIDALEYMITTALGFSAIENTLFILNPLIAGNAAAGYITGNMRFIGASLLHILSSATLGYFIGREFYEKHISVRFFFATLGLVLAIALHSIFNYFIIYENGTNVFLVFSFVWAGAILLLLFFEKIKRLKA